MEAITYRLDSVANGKNFYEELSVFTTRFLELRSAVSLLDIENFIAFTKTSHTDELKTFDEYYLEYLTLGILLNKYSANAMSSGVLSMNLLKFLYKYRNSIEALKPVSDKVRGLLSTLLLKNEIIFLKVRTAGRLKHFLKWLEATGEYTEETIRFKNWYLYIKGLESDNLIALLDNASKAATEFETLAKTSFGIFTQNVEIFRQNELRQHRFKENFIFCGKYEVEYHLNMFGAEILNRTFKNEFLKTGKKVILFPTCMSNPENGKCKARKKGSALICTDCSANCNINLKRKEFSSQNIEVALIPHSSDFTKYLKYWKNQKTTGLVGVACVLNLLKGGYEMQKLNIPSQCVFLDYCGCKKHWHKDGISTNLNNEQLKRVLEINNLST